MKSQYIAKVQANLKGKKLIYATNKTTRLLEGNHDSIYKGRSMNFDKLRAYAPGDEVADIDWMASARNHSLMTKQYIAEKKHNVLLILDNNASMSAHTNSLEIKKDTAIMSAGTVAYFAYKYGDYVGAVYAKGDGFCVHPFKTQLYHIEQILKEYDEQPVVKGQRALEEAIGYVLNHIKKRMVIFIVTDMEGIYQTPQKELKRLAMVHDVFLLAVSDADWFGEKVYSVEQERYLPAFFTKDKKLKKLEQEKRAQRLESCLAKCKSCQIAFSVIENAQEADIKIMELLERHEREKRR